MNERELQRKTLFETDSSILYDLETKAKEGKYLLEGCSKKVTLRLLDEALCRQIGAESIKANSSEPANVFLIMGLLLGGAVVGFITLGILIVNQEEVIKTIQHITL